jgi:hypothetical protein
MTEVCIFNVPNALGLAVYKFFSSETLPSVENVDSKRSSGGLANFRGARPQDELLIKLIKVCHITHSSATTTMINKSKSRIMLHLMIITPFGKNRVGVQRCLIFVMQSSTTTATHTYLKTLTK